MQTAEKLAATGLTYTRFHTTALSSPTRVALLTGYNHHSNNAGSIMETATMFPGNTGVRPQSITPMAEVLSQNGYSTAAFGKYHETPPWEISIAGSLDRWPTHSGFDKFYGFIGGETNQWSPLVYDGVTQVELPKDPKYHFTTDMTNQAVSWVRFQQALSPEKPFFVYFAPGATHAPHHAPKEYIEKYRGKFDQGWDKVREATLEHQKQLGIVPQNTKLAPKPTDIKDWEKLSADEKKLFARQMETYAGFGEHVDYEIGRLLSAIDDLGEMDNTLIFYILGDNGASAEGQMNGMFSEMTYFNGVPETVPDMLKHYDEWGSPSTYPHYRPDGPWPWTPVLLDQTSRFRLRRHAQRHDRPLARGLQGQRRTPHAVHACDRHCSRLSTRPARSLRRKRSMASRRTRSRGRVFCTRFNEPTAKERHTVQYFEMFGNRGIYKDGWMAQDHSPGGLVDEGESSVGRRCVGIV